MSTFVPEQKVGSPIDDLAHDKDGEDVEEEKGSGSRSPEEKKGGADSNVVNSGNKVFVGNLSFKTTWQKLKDHMKQIGNVVRVNIFEDRNKRSKGCGVVEFESKEDAQKAMKELHESLLDGRNIYLREDNPDLARYDHENARSKKSDRPRRSGSRSSQDRKRNRSRSPYSPRDKKYSRRSRSRSPRHDKRRRDSRSHSRGRDKGFKIIVKNIPWSVTWQQLKDAFKEYGAVRADVAQDDKGRSAGYGWVKFEREKDAVSAKDGMDGASFNGRKIKVIIE